MGRRTASRRDLSDRGDHGGVALRVARLPSGRNEITHLFEGRLTVLTCVNHISRRFVNSLRLPTGRRKTDLADRIQCTLDEDFIGRIFWFDDHAVLATA